MKEFQPESIRNMALVGHIASGKTMLCESMLVCGGVINRLGRIAQGNTASDFHDEEQKHLHSMHATLLHTEWQGKKINIVDTPGYADFIGETLSALHVVDLAAIVINGENGIELGTETAWAYAQANNLEKFFIITALDKSNAQFDTLVAELREQFDNHILPITIPVTTGPTFNQILDVLNKKVISYKDFESGTTEISEPTGQLKELADKLHQQLIECVAESDDALLEKFFAQGSLDDKELFAALKQAIKTQLLMPVFAASGEHNIGISSILNFVTQYGISPLDKTEIAVTNEKKENITLSATDKHPNVFIFKTSTESKSGGLSYIKVLSGEIKPGVNLYNNTRKISERIGQLFLLNGKNRLQINSLCAGDIGAVTKLKDSHTNETLSDPSKIIDLPKIAYPHSNIHLAIHAKVKDNEEKLVAALTTLHDEDPTLSHKVDSELHQLIMSGQGEMHLETCVEKLRHRFNLEVETYQPRIAYRETIKGQGDSKYRHKKQSGGAGQFAEVWMRVEPKSHDDDVEFTQSLVGQNVDRVFVPSVEKGVKSASQKGSLAGYKVVGVKVDFYDGKQHPVDSKDIAFQIAGQFAFREAFANAKPCLLEPIMLVTVNVPDDFTGHITSDLSSRRGKILSIDTEGRYTIIKANVPQAEMYRYATTLRSIAGGRGIHSEAFSHYEEMPKELEQKIVVQHKANATEPSVL